MITMVPNSRREANAAASCKIVHNSECFRMVFGRCSAVVRGLRTRMAVRFTRQTLNRLLPNLISNYLLTLTDGPDPALRLFRDDGNHGRSLTHNPAASRSPAWLSPAHNPRRK